MKKSDVIKAAVDDLKKEYNITINDGYFTKKETEQAEFMQKAKEVHEATLQAQQDSEKEKQIQAAACDVVDAQEVVSDRMTQAI